MPIKLSPLNEQQLNALNSLSSGLNREQIVWLSGYFQGLHASPGDILPISIGSRLKSNKQLKILYGTHTGHSKLIAANLAEKLSNTGVEVMTIALDDYKIRQLSGETNVVVIVSTHGEGEPPAMAEEFHEFVNSKRAPKLAGLSYSVLALGDKSYKLFCKTGTEIDKALSRLGAKAILPVLKLDVDFEEEAADWINRFVSVFNETSEIALLHPIVSDKYGVAETYSRRNPFMATVLDKVKITGRDSDKEVYHLELSLDGSGITYEPGDSVGILANNPPHLVEAVLIHLSFDGTESVNLKEGVFSFRKALTDHLEITVINREVIQKYLEKTLNGQLKELVENEQQLDEYLYGHDLLDLMEDFPAVLTAQELADVLRNFPARLYSISSSQAAVGDEVHITVATVRYSHNGRERAGACSSYLADRIELDSQVSVFIEKNPAFKLPEDENTPVILIGAGTGVAPYRAFLQQREANNQKGNTWLFFGDRRFHSDFLYQLEWQKLLKNGYLERIDIAFSRDQEEKLYVQHRLIENQKEIFKWLNNGANIYLCGDMKQMARDVQKTLLQIFETEGGMSSEKALDYLKTLKKQKRFQSDVY